ncbi:manganese transporter [Pseudozyma hubeiensis SY62]|uniref:Manganese transporter n=1 Tax=Pseudozyma hubeiensis (strain SY62) TaxID=1305764 RepID=R9NYC5_PSEHS|nr:manganese transporter [Pseudozyma hubeiensis SY62]GAC93617.1 manganese transporter [Pseudozyma hubeiensis SY62]
MPPPTIPPQPAMATSASPPSTATMLKQRMAACCATTLRVLRRHLYFVGPGIVASVAYADPGNWATDLQAGSEFGYSLLFIVLLTGCFAVIIQILSCRLGVVTNADLARQCRMLILKEDRLGNPTQQRVSHPKLRRWALLYPLYIIAEGAIIATELAELTGSAIALNLLFPALPLWAGILITSVDVIIILFIYKPPPNGSFRLLEALIAALVFTVLACFIVLLVRIDPHWPDVFHGYLPSHHVVQSGALYVSVGILGATVMPHAIILGSHFAVIDRLPNPDGSYATRDDESQHDRTPDTSHQSRWQLITGSLSRLLRPKTETKTETLRLTRVIRSLIQYRTGTTHDVETDSMREARRARFKPQDFPPRTLENIRIHIKHASVDIGMSLVSFAIVINSAILIVAAAAFYYDQNGSGSGQVVVASLYDAFYLLKDRLGSLAAVLFAVALLAAGQSASITVTLAGQLVSEGFINWRTDPFLRRVVTRLVAIVPSLTVSLAVGKDGLDEMLVASQVALSIALPFVLLPLILVTSSKPRMTAELAVEEHEMVASRASSMRSSVDADRTSADGQLSAVGEQGSASGVKARPELSSTASESASLAVIQSLPLQQEPPTPDQDRKLPSTSQHQQEQPVSTPTASPSDPLQPNSVAPQPLASPDKSHCFASAWYVQAVLYAIFAVIVVADGYVLITTFMGES